MRENDEIRWRDGRCPVPNLGTTRRSSLQNMEEIGRKHPIHLDVHDRRDAPIIVFLTVCMKDRKAILASSESQALLIAAWGTAKMWRVGRYVIMPDHVHLFCAPAESETQPLLQWVKYWKSAVARTWVNPVVSGLAASFLGYAIAQERKLRSEMAVRRGKSSSRRVGRETRGLAIPR